MIIFLDDKNFRFNIYLLFDKFDLIILIAFKMFFNDSRYDNDKYTHFRIDCDIKFDNY